MQELHPGLESGGPLAAWSDLCKAACASDTFLQENIRKVGEQSEQCGRPKTAVLRMDPSVSRPEFIYSIQTFNSKEQAKKLLQRHLAQVCFLQRRLWPLS